MNLGSMTDDRAKRDKPAPTVSAKAQVEQQARLEREAAALRENLRRRKEQARARASRPTEHMPE